MKEKYPLPPDPWGQYSARPSISEIFSEESAKSSSLYLQATHSGDYRRFVGLKVRWLGSLCRLFSADTLGALRPAEAGLFAPVQDGNLWTVQLDGARKGAFDERYHIQFLVDIENFAELKIAEHRQVVMVCGKIAFFKMPDTAVLDDVMFHVYPEKLNPSWVDHVKF